MVCPVCGKKNQSMMCPECGFDSSRDYEKYPTLAPVGKTPAVSARKKEWRKQEKPAEPPKKKRPWLPLIACIVTLFIGIGIGAGFGGGKPVSTEPSENMQMQAPPETTEAAKPAEMPWSANVLRGDAVPISDSHDSPVLGSEYRRNQIKSITFLDTLANAPGDAWDVSESGDGKVLAWVTPNGNRYDLFIGADGGVAAGKSCEGLFSGYTKMEQIYNMHFLHTEGVQDMGYMFYGCAALTSLDLSSFDTANVQDMGYMFYNCASLTGLDLSSFDTANVEDMRKMFYNCNSLTSLDLSSFETSSVVWMHWMFNNCVSLTSLDLSSFDTSNVQSTVDMFGYCPAGDDWKHLLK